MVLVFGFIYGWITPLFLGPRRYEQESRWYFIGVYALTLAGAVIFTLGRSPKRNEFASLVLVLIVWIYLFFFIMLNSFGS